MRRLRPFLLAGIPVLAYLATGIIVVQPNEKVIVRRFGAAVAPPLEPGLHLDFPWGLSKIERVRVVLVSGIPTGEVAELGMVPAADLAAGIARAHDLLGNEPARAIVMPRAGETLPRIARD